MGSQLPLVHRLRLLTDPQALKASWGQAMGKTHSTNEWVPGYACAKLGAGHSKRYIQKKEVPSLDEMSFTYKLQ